VKPIGLTSVCVAVQSLTDGGWIKLADDTTFPISKDMLGAIVYFAPGGMR
jgi:hypothetical protein